jgi:hypothetical protein
MSNIAPLIRQIYYQKKDGRIDEKIAEELIQQLKKMCLAKNYSFDSCDDVVNQSFINLYKSIDENSFWETVIEENEENDKRIKNYIYKILLSSNNELDKDFRRKETINFNRALSEILKNLVAENILQTKDSFYHLTSTQTPEDVDFVDFPSLYFPVRNANGTIDWNRLKELIIIIFNEYLEKYSLSLSNITEIISKITDIGNTSLISIDLSFDSDEDDYSTIQIKDSKTNQEDISTIKSIVNIWIERAEKIFDEEELKLRAVLFLLKYGENYTLEEIKDKLNLAKGKSSIDNYIKQFIKSMRIENEVGIDDSNINDLMNYLILSLSEKYDMDVYTERLK